MNIVFESRASDSPYIERIWRSHSTSGGWFTSIAATHSMLVIERVEGDVKLYLRGPETHATTADCPPDGEWLGIIFKFGAFMPHFPGSGLIDGDAAFAVSTKRAFWLHSDIWELPDYDNAETFANRLVRRELLIREPAVNTLLWGGSHDLSLRSLQRHYWRATGMTHRSAQAIERARNAATLLQNHIPILDVVHETGYFDQALMTKALKRYIGRTPAQLNDPQQVGQLSFQYNTDAFCWSTIEPFAQQSGWTGDRPDAPSRAANHDHFKWTIR